jgi:hypothetical protein
MKGQTKQPGFGKFPGRERVKAFEPKRNQNFDRPVEIARQDVTNMFENAPA